MHTEPLGWGCGCGIFSLTDESSGFAPAGNRQCRLPIARVLSLAVE